MAQINKPDLYFNTKLYTGDGTSNRSITGVNFQPDLVWIKNRNSTNNHQWVDSVRGLFRLGSDSTVAEASVSGAFNSFDADGFNVTEEVNWEFNNSGKTYASWNFLAGGTASSNTDGSITSNVSANTTSGFSIVSWTGTGANATVGHGLGTTPSMIITKSRSAIGNWYTYHQSLGATKFLQLQDTSNDATSSAFWNNTEPTSSVFSTGTAFDNGTTYIAYCFAEKQGFSKFGKYVGNGSTDGTFVYTGFKPAFVIIKAYDTAGLMWNIRDNKRDTFNPNDTVLYPNSNEVENAHGDNDVDWLSNGFKMRTTNGHTNQNGVGYIYMAFAEQPLVGTNNIPGTAR